MPTSNKRIHPPSEKNDAPEVDTQPPAKRQEIPKVVSTIQFITDKAPTTHSLQALIGDPVQTPQNINVSSGRWKLHWPGRGSQAVMTGVVRNQTLFSTIPVVSFVDDLI
jgi:hypothetical protein